MNHKLETLAAGALYVGLGTIIAVQVSAADKSCSSNEAPDAMCTVGLKQGPETKLCFNGDRARCFEIKNSHLIQTIGGGAVQDSALKPQELASAKSSIEKLAGWLEGQLKGKSPTHSQCRDVITYDVKSTHKEYCASKLVKTDVQAKTREALLTLEAPSAKSSH